jgi:Uma2 family endonuclease
MTEITEARVFGPASEETDLVIPDQGNWTEEEFLRAFPERGYELSNGFVEVLPMPTDRHQAVLEFLYRAAWSFVTSRELGTVRSSGIRVRLWEEKIRQPDVTILLRENTGRNENKFWRGADLAIEVVSDDKPSRDWKVKRAEYAAAGIREYWIVDPRDRSITVLSLPDGEKVYREAGRYTEGQTAASLLLDGFRVDVTDVFTAD